MVIEWLEGIDVGNPPLVCPNIVECLPRECYRQHRYFELLVGRRSD